MTIKVDPIHDFSHAIVYDFEDWEEALKKTLGKGSIFKPPVDFIGSHPSPLFTIQTAAALGADPSMNLWELVSYQTPPYRYASSLYDLWDDKIKGHVQTLKASLLPESQNWLLKGSLEATAIARSRQEAAWLRSWLMESGRMFLRGKREMYYYNQWFGGADHEQLKLILRWKQENGHCSPEIHRDLLNPVHTGLMAEYNACQAAEGVHQRTLMLRNAAKTVYTESSPLLVTEPEVIYPPPPTTLRTPGARLSRLVGCLGFVASAVPICLLFYQLSNTDHPFEVAKNFVQDMAIGSLMPSFSAAMVYEGAKYIFNA